MRKIKFRAWDSESKCFLNKSSFRIYGDGDIAVFDDGHDFRDSGWEVSEDIILMQCTGQKDMNGIDIYEGDIVTYVNEKNPDKDQPLYMCEWVEDKAKFALNPLDGKIDDSRIGFNHKTHYRFKVLGNIFEKA